MSTPKITMFFLCHYCEEATTVDLKLGPTKFEVRQIRCGNCEGLQMSIEINNGQSSCADTGEFVQTKEHHHVDL